MSLMNRFFKRKNFTTAEKAKERLKIILAKERTSTSFAFMDDMRRDILEVMKKYIDVQEVSIKSEQNDEVDLLEVEISVGRYKTLHKSEIEKLASSKPEFDEDTNINEIQK